MVFACELPIIDLAAVAERHPLADALAAREARLTFDLARGPLLRNSSWSHVRTIPAPDSN